MPLFACCGPRLVLISTFATGRYIVRFFDTPGPRLLSLPSDSLSTVLDAPCGPWCLQNTALVVRPTLPWMTALRRGRQTSWRSRPSPHPDLCFDILPPMGRYIFFVFVLHGTPWHASACLGGLSFIVIVTPTFASSPRPNLVLIPAGSVVGDVILSSHNSVVWGWSRVPCWG